MEHGRIAFRLPTILILFALVLSSAIAVQAAGVNADRGSFHVALAPPLAPVLSAPADNAITGDSTPTLTWSVIDGAAEYELTLAADAGFTTPVLTYHIAAASFTPPASLVQGKYYWRVRACDSAGSCSVYSTVRSFTLNIQSLPADGAILLPLAAPMFTWASVEGASGYQVFIASDVNFSTLTYSSPVLSSSTFSYSLPTSNALGIGTYYWRVAVSGYPSLSTVYRSLAVTLPAPTPLAPSNGSTTTDWTPTFSWTAVTYSYGTVTYHLMVDNNSDFSSPLHNISNISGTSWTPTSSMADGTYYWRVQAVITSGGTWSATWSVNVDAVTVTDRGRLFWHKALAGCVNPTSHDRWYFEIFVGSGANVWFDIVPTEGNITVDMSPYNRYYPALPRGQGYWVTVAPTNNTSGCYIIVIHSDQNEDIIPTDARLYWDTPVAVCTSPTDYNSFYFEIWDRSTNVWFEIQVTSGSITLPTRYYNHYYPYRAHGTGYDIALWPENGGTGCYRIIIHQG